MGNVESVSISSKRNTNFLLKILLCYFNMLDVQEEEFVTLSIDYRLYAYVGTDFNCITYKKQIITAK